MPTNVEDFTIKMLSNLKMVGDEGVDQCMTLLETIIYWNLNLYKLVQKLQKVCM